MVAKPGRLRRLRPALDPTAVYVVAGTPATLWALNRSDGSTRWAVNLTGSSLGGSSPAIGSNFVYVASASGALDAIGPYQWLGPPTVAWTKPFIGDMVEIGLDPGDPSDPIDVQRRVLGAGEAWGAWQDLGTILPNGSNTIFKDSTVMAGQVYQYRAETVLATGGPARLHSPRGATQPSDFERAGLGAGTASGAGDAGYAAGRGALLDRAERDLDAG